MVIGKIILSLLILFIAALIAYGSLSYFPADFTHGFLLGKKELFNGIYKYGFYAHVISTPIVITIGTLQTFFRFEKKYPKLHRNAGKIYVATVLFLAAPGGLIMAFSAIGGQLSELCFLLLAMLWIYFTYKAYQEAKNKNFSEHKRHMQRSFILMLSAINLRILMFIFIRCNFEGPQMYTVAAWLSWLPGLLIYEFVQYRKTQVP
ncbi:MAG: DUF2306 domain-containing protein [Flavobacteriales bacterium]